MRLFRRRTPFRRIFGDTSGDTLPLYPVPRLATLCESIMPFNSMICKGLCGQYAPACTPLQLWKKLTQNRRGQPRGGSTPPPGTNKISELVNQRILGCVFLCPDHDQSRSIGGIQVHGPFLIEGSEISSNAHSAASSDHRQVSHAQRPRGSIDRQSNRAGSRATRKTDAVGLIHQFASA